MLHRKLNIFALALGTAFCTAVLAQQAPSTPSTPSTGAGPSSTAPSPGTSAPARGATEFGAIDTDRDGFISRAEATGVGLGGQFTTLDKNNDGKLDRSEFAARSGDDMRAPGMQSGTSPAPGTTTTR